MEIRRRICAFIRNAPRLALALACVAHTTVLPATPGTTVNAPPVHIDHVLHAMHTYFRSIESAEYTFSIRQSPDGNAARKCRCAQDADRYSMEDITTPAPVIPRVGFDGTAGWIVDTASRRVELFRSNVPGPQEECTDLLWQPFGWIPLSQTKVRYSNPEYDMADPVPTASVLSHPDLRNPAFARLHELSTTNTLLHGRPVARLELLGCATNPSDRPTTVVLYVAPDLGLYPLRYEITSRKGTEVSEVRSFLLEHSQGNSIVIPTKIVRTGMQTTLLMKPKLNQRLDDSRFRLENWAEGFSLVNGDTRRILREPNPVDEFVHGKFNALQIGEEAESTMPGSRSLWAFAGFLVIVAVAWQLMLRARL